MDTAKTEGPGATAPEENASMVPGPGARLREAREAKNMSISEVASELRIRADMVQALESDQYDLLSAPIFVKGYLRNFSKLVGLGEERVLAQYHAQRPVEPVLTLAVSEKSGKQRSVFSDWRIGLGIAMLLGIAGIFLFSGSDENNVAEESAHNRESMDTGVSGQQQDAAVIEEYVHISMDAETVESIAPASRVEDRAMSNEAGQLLAEAEVVMEDLPRDQPDSDSDAVSAVVDGSLEIIVSDDCWAEIWDSKGRRLVYALLRSGSSRTVSGSPPYAVLFGNADGIRLRFNNEPYDFSGHVRRNVARFKLGK